MNPKGPKEQARMTDVDDLGTESEWTSGNWFSQMKKVES